MSKVKIAIDDERSSSKDAVTASATASALVGTEISAHVLPGVFQDSSISESEEEPAADFADFLVDNYRSSDSFTVSSKEY